MQQSQLRVGQFPTVLETVFGAYQALELEQRVDALEAGLSGDYFLRKLFDMSKCVRLASRVTPPRLVRKFILRLRERSRLKSLIEKFLFDTKKARFWLQRVSTEIRGRTWL